MKKRTRFAKFLIIVGVGLSLLWLNVGSLRCESSSSAPDRLSSQAKNDNPGVGKKSDQSWLSERDEKSERFQVLEWLIKQQLLAKYQKLEVNEDLDN